MIQGRERQLLAILSNLVAARPGQIALKLYIVILWRRRVIEPTGGLDVKVAELARLVSAGAAAECCERDAEQRDSCSENHETTFAALLISIRRGERAA